MKFAVNVIAGVILLVAFGLNLPLTVPTSAASAGPSVDGKFEINIQGEPARSIEFKASLASDGTTTGEVVFKDTTPTPASAGESTDTKSSSSTFFLKAEFDCLVVQANKAIMSGNITESSVKYYVGRRLILVAQDNGGGVNLRARDKLTWGVYRPTKKDWLVTDSERPDEAPSNAWVATDAERPELSGVFLDQEEIVGCQTFPLSSFSFLDAGLGRGTVHVRS